MAAKSSEFRPRVLLTRPGERGQRLAEAFSTHAVEALALDVMSHQLLPETPAQRSIWLDIDQYRRIVVVSPFAAECLADALDRYWPQLPLGPSFYAVGAATAEVLHQRLGVRVHVPMPERGETSEALLALPSLAALDEQKVLLVAGEGGRPLLAEALVARGAQLARLALYRRVLLPPEGEAREWLAQGDYAALVISSGEVLEYLAGWCGSKALNQPLIVSSRRLATLADSLGFAEVRVAGGASVAALMAAVLSACDLDDAEDDHDDLEKG
ncbi:MULTISPECIES: uroporphyrinogen-III synthase [Halomonadaceae]|uniref:uroporphyrinogen-III synthase n=1 Tax=Halomonadaceae TaxID=28256 RepID=UPI00159A543D|nr:MULTISPECIES: uroporphyrinogen-III synthase [Halomonas]QJQ95450.1 uroporphyrinogen-III synthase [Halomonas sp. PA5]